MTEKKIISEEELIKKINEMRAKDNRISNQKREMLARGVLLLKSGITREEFLGLLNKANPRKIRNWGKVKAFLEENPDRYFSLKFIQDNFGCSILPQSVNKAKHKHGFFSKLGYVGAKDPFPKGKIEEEKNK